eukprot:1119270_1
MAQQLVYPEFVEVAPRVSEFKVHCAVDFGTDGVAIAYAFGEANKDVTAHAEWSHKKYAPKFKPKTIVLLDEDHRAIGFGKDAKHTYMVTDTMKDKWMLFERFKMSLNEDGPPGTSGFADDEKKQVQINDTLTATNGKIVKASVVFCAVFKHLQKQAKSYLKRNKLSRGLFKTLTDKDWQWIITVPAIWNDASKYKMRQWAIDAGLIDPGVEGQCKIVYEPDCASLALQYEINDNKSRIGTTDETPHSHTTFTRGDKYILVDAGGGTVDIACHEILGQNGEYGVKEILAPSGGPWGSTFIDDQFEALLHEVFGEERMSDFSEENANVHTALLHNFQQAKEAFFGQDKHNVRIPFDFIDFMQDKLEETTSEKEDIETFVSSQTTFGESNLLSLSAEYLEIDKKGWEIMFNHVVEPIIDHIHKLLAEPKLMRNCKYLCLAGGLSSSPYFQSKMTEMFGSKSKYGMDVIIPNRPILSVVEGAAYFGITPNYIKARVLRYTYGLCVTLTKSRAVSNGVPSDYIEKNEYYDHYNNCWRVENCFQIFARQNKEIHTGQIITKHGRRQNLEDEATEIQILFSEMECPKVLSDGKVLGSIRIEWDNETDVEGTCEFHFYDTLIRVVVYPSKQPEKKQTRYITNYQSNQRVTDMACTTTQPVQQCVDCGQVQMGRIYDGDGLFYCDKCYNYYYYENL